MISILKKTLFWILFIPNCLLLLIISIPARIFGTLEDWLDKTLRRYEEWTFDILLGATEWDEKEQKWVRF